MEFKRYSVKAKVNGHPFETTTLKVFGCCDEIHETNDSQFVIATSLGVQKSAIVILSETELPKD
jgi:hypothetical protein